jgi:hypothetical protein
VAELDVDLIPDFDELENQLDDEDLTKEVTFDGGGGAGGGGGGAGDGLLATLGIEAGTDIASGARGGGALGKLAGGLSSAVLLLGSVVGLLAILEPIQKAIGFLVRQVELFVVPFVSALRPVLELVQKAAVRLVQILRNPREFFSGLISTVKRALAPLINRFVRAINSTIPGANIQTVSAGGQGSIRGAGQEFESAGQTGESGAAASTLAEIGAKAATTSNPALTGLSNTLLSDDATNEALFNLANSVLGGGRTE